MLLTHRSQAAQLEAGRKDQQEGSPVERKGLLGGIVAARMDPGSSAEARRTARTGPRQA